MIVDKIYWCKDCHIYFIKDWAKDYEAYSIKYPCPNCGSINKEEMEVMKESYGKFYCRHRGEWGIPVKGREKNEKK